MTVPPSTIPAVKRYLVTAITSAVNDQSVLITYGEPGTELPPDVIAVTDTERTVEPTQMVGSGGPGWLYESYHQVVIVSCQLGDDDQQKVDERAYGLLALVEQAVLKDPSLGELVTGAYPASSSAQSGWVLAEDGIPEGRGCDIELRIQIMPTPQ